MKKVMRNVGVEITFTRRQEPSSPGAEGTMTILGSYPPAEDWFAVGKAENYFIHDGYAQRSSAAYFDATQHGPGWQVEVYRFASEICNRESLRVICDLGCGSAFKLMRFLGDRETLGIDVPQTCAYLRKKYPRRRWIESDFATVPITRPDLLLASDVIEHVQNPDDMLAFIENMLPKWIILSTPDRNLLRTGRHNGPPMNAHHIREWSFAEFHAYIGSRFQIVDHFISNCAQATQCVLCRPRGST